MLMLNASLIKKKSNKNDENKMLLVLFCRLLTKDSNSSYCLLSAVIYLLSLGPNLNPQGVSNRMLKLLTRYDTFMLDSNSKFPYEIADKRQ